MGNLANGPIVECFTRLTWVGGDQVTQPRGRGVGFSHPVIVRDDRKLQRMHVSKEEIVVFRYMRIPQLADERLHSPQTGDDFIETTGSCAVWKEPPVRIYISDPSPHPGAVVISLLDAKDDAIRPCDDPFVEIVAHISGIRPNIGVKYSISMHSGVDGADPAQWCVLPVAVRNSSKPPPPFNGRVFHNAVVNEQIERDRTIRENRVGERYQIETVIPGNA